MQKSIVLQNNLFGIDLSDFYASFNYVRVVLPHDDLCSLKILLHQHNEHMLLLFTSCLCIILYVKCKTDISFSFGCYITLFHSELQLNFL